MPTAIRVPKRWQCLLTCQRHATDVTWVVTEMKEQYDGRATVVVECRDCALGYTQRAIQHARDKLQEAQDAHDQVFEQ